MPVLGPAVACRPGDLVQANTMVIQPDRKIIAAGVLGNDLPLMRSL